MIVCIFTPSALSNIYIKLLFTSFSSGLISPLPLGSPWLAASASGESQWAGHSWQSRRVQRKQRMLLLRKNKIRRGSRRSLRGPWGSGAPVVWTGNTTGSSRAKAAVMGLREPGAPRGTDVCTITWFPALQCLLLLISSFFFLFGFLF